MTPDERLGEYFSPERLREAYYEYKSRKTDRFNQDLVTIPMGADGVTFDAFEKELNRNVHNISRRVLEGRYFFYPFREVDIPKPGGGTRTLSVASIRDALVQQQLYMTVYPLFERLFRQESVDHVSFAYRKGRSAPQAAIYIHRYLESGYVYALDADVVKYFDTIPHQELLHQVGRLVGERTKTYSLIRRFISTDRVLYVSYKTKRHHRLLGKETFRKLKPHRTKRGRGIPQGGVLSGMLANLFLHEFDLWVMEEVSRIIDLKYVRYADDFVILVKENNLLEPLRQMVASQLESFGLELHTDPKKTRLIDVRKTGLDFVGFHFTAYEIRVRERNVEKFKERFEHTLESDAGWNVQFNTVKRRLSAVINRKLNVKICGPQEEICPICNGPKGNKPRSWMSYFYVVTDIEQINELDRWIREQTIRYFLRRYGLRASKKMLSDLGLKSLRSEYYRLRKRKTCECPETENAVETTESV